MLLSDKEILDRSIQSNMIRPFCLNQVSRDVVSWGVGSYGYDIRIGNEFEIFSMTPPIGVVDPKNFDRKLLKNITADTGERVLIPPNTSLLGKSVEYVNIPRDILGVCIGKSTYARCGLIVNVTPLEPEWEGIITIEVSNLTPFTSCIYAGEGIMQVIFLKGSQTCETSYADRNGKYQRQLSITFPTVSK